MTTTPLVPATAVDVHVPPYAGWGRRVVAALLDGAVLGAVAWLVGGDGITAPSLQPTLGPAPGDDVLAWTSSVYVAGAWLGMLVLQGLTGQTPGRRVMRIAVAHAPADGPVGGPPGVLRSVVRWFAHLLDAILFIGYMRPLWHVERRTFADSIAGTVVLDRRPVARGDRTGTGLTVGAWVVVVMGLVAGVGLGESSGLEQGPESRCALTAQDTDAPVLVRDITLVSETEWSRTLRIWTPSDDVRRAEQQRLSLELSWGVTGPTAGDEALHVRVGLPSGDVEHQVNLADGWATFPVERAEGGPVDVEVTAGGRVLTTCSAGVPGT